MGNKRTKKSISLEGFVFLAIFLGIFGGMGMKMGGVNMLNTLMNTGYQLLLETPVPLMKESLSFHGLERSLNSSYHRFLDSQMHPESPFRSRHSVLPVPQSD